MSDIQRSFFGGLVILTALATADTARGGFVTETVSTGSQGTRTDFSINLALPTFNTDLGTLTGVSLVLDLSETMNGTITNHANRQESYQVTETSNFTLALYGQQLLTNTLSSQQTYSNLGSQAAASFGSYQTQARTAPVNVSSGSLFDAFLSKTGQTDLTLSSLTSTIVVGGGGNASTGIYTTAIGSVSVTFTYIPYASSVPEPSSLAMTAAGLGLVSAAVFRRKKPLSDSGVAKKSSRNPSKMR